MFQDDDDDESGMEETEDEKSFSFSDAVGHVEAELEDKDKDKRKRREAPFGQELVLNEKDLHDNRFPNRSASLFTLLRIMLQYAHGELPSPDILRLASDRAIRRPVELLLLPKKVYMQMPSDRAWLYALVPPDKIKPDEKGPDGKIDKEKLVEKPLEEYQKLEEGSGKKLYGPTPTNGKVPARRRQRQYIKDGSKTETGARKKQVTYFVRWNRVRTNWRRRLRQRGFKDRLDARLEDLNDEEQFIWIVEFHQAWRDACKEFHDFIRGWNALIQYQRIVKWAEKRTEEEKEKTGKKFHPNEHPKYHVYRLVSYNTIGRWDHWHESIRRAEAIPEERVDEVILGGEGTQSLAESIDAQNGLYDMVSAILTYPNVWVEEIPSADEDYKGIRCFIVHCEKVVYESAYALGSLRKTQDHRKIYLTLVGTAALALLRKDDGSKARDKWYMCNIPEIPLVDLLVQWMDSRIFLRELANEPLDFVIPDGPRQGGEAIEEWGMHNEAVNFFRWWMIRTKLGKEVLFLKELVENVKLVNYSKDQVYWAYVSGKPGEEEFHYEPGPGRRPVAVPKHLMVLKTNFIWALVYNNFALADLVDNTNNMAKALGYDVRMTFDGPDSNLFRILDLALQVWWQQPLENIKALLDRRVRHLVEGGKWLELRREVTEFFQELPVHRVVGEMEVNGEKHPNMDLMDLYEDYLRMADQLHIGHLIWYTVEGDARLDEIGDTKKATGGGICVYPTERMVWRYPNDLWGRVDRQGREQFSPYTFNGQQKARKTIMFLSYDANLVVGTIKGLVDKLVVGVQPTVEEVYDDIISHLGTRRLYLKRVMNVLDLVESHFSGSKLVHFGRRFGVPIGKETIGGDKIARDALKLMRNAVKIALKQGPNGPSEKVDLLGHLIVRDLFGEVINHGGWVDAVRKGGVIEEIRSKLPSAR